MRYHYKLVAFLLIVISKAFPIKQLIEINGNKVTENHMLGHLSIFDSIFLNFYNKLNQVGPFSRKNPFIMNLSCLSY